jgi:hypothetical protein
MFKANQGQSQPTAEELAAADAARRDKLTSTQDYLTRATDQLFRLYGARAAAGGGGSSSGGALGSIFSPLSARV